MTAGDVKWKSKLLASSAPLEYEAARQLVDQGFAVTADFAYSRDDAGVAKDFSVDLQATRFLEHDSRDLNAQLELLVECKYRHPSVRWLFFPDPNPGDFSPHTLGCTLRAVDEFSDVFLPPDCTVAWEADVDFCLKGVEVDLSSGAVHDSEIRHGLMQLQYALPAMLSRSIWWSLFGLDERPPFLFCPVLLTTADILVAHDDVSVTRVQDASALEDIAHSAPYVVVNVDPGPDFERHRMRQLEGLAEYAQDRAVIELSESRRLRGEYDFRLPTALCEEFAAPGRPMHEFFGQILVCTMPGFTSLVDELVSLSTDAALHVTSEVAHRQ